MTQEAKKRRCLPNYRINIHAISPRHPLGIKPSGNSLLQSMNAEKANMTRVKLLGDFSIFPEDLLVELLTYMTGQDMKNLGHCSRLLYAYTYNDEYWRKLYITEYCRLEKLQYCEEIAPFGSLRWRGSWRKTVLNIEYEALLQSNALIFSDLLYRPYQCSKINYRELFKSIIDLEKKSYDYCRTLNEEFGIKRFNEKNLSIEDFKTRFVDQPFILQSQGVEDRWPNWDLDHLLKLFPEERFRQEAVQWELSKYINYARNNKDESPLYLFDCNGAPIEQIAKQYEPPDIFKEDFFKVFKNGNIQCRPDHRWLIAGPERSGSTFHKDPNQTCAWNTVLSGMKLWIMLPPEVSPPGIITDKDEDEVTAPVGISEWILSGFYNDSIQLALEGRCRIGITFPGECLYVPSGWWHSVINITDTVALTENFVPEPVLGKVLHFLENKNCQISGFHPKDVVTSVKAFLDSCRDKSNPETDKHVELLQNFIKESNNCELDNEDCGVQVKPKLRLPVHEFFLELIKESSYKDYLPAVLEELKKKDLEHSINKFKESSIWKKLKNDESTFSFGFAMD